MLAMPSRNPESSQGQGLTWGLQQLPILFWWFLIIVFYPKTLVYLLRPLYEVNGPPETLNPKKKNWTVKPKTLTPNPKPYQNILLQNPILLVKAPKP